MRGIGSPPLFANRFFFSTSREKSDKQTLKGICGAISKNRNTVVFTIGRPIAYYAENYLFRFKHLDEKIIIATQCHLAVPDCFRDSSSSL